MNFISAAAFLAEIQQGEVIKTSCKYVGIPVSASWSAVGHATCMQLSMQYTMYVMVGRELINRPVNACFEWSKVESADVCKYTFECIVSAGELGRFNLGTWQRVNEAAQ